MPYADLAATRANDRAYGMAHREERKARSAAWRKANPERAAELKHRHYEANKDKYHEASKRWRANNPGGTYLIGFRYYRRSKG